MKKIISLFSVVFFLCGVVSAQSWHINVGIYLGSGEFIHATVNSKKVTILNIADAYYSSRFAGARRVL